VELVLEIPPEFDPDSAEFVSDISDYATEFKRRDVEIPLEFDPDAMDLVSDKMHNSTNLQWEGIEIPPEFDPDSPELVPDITEYTSKLKQVRKILFIFCCAVRCIVYTNITFSYLTVVT
jgi:hypothetical protein